MYIGVSLATCHHGEADHRAFDQGRLRHRLGGAQLQVGIREQPQSLFKLCSAPSARLFCQGGFAHIGHRWTGSGQTCLGATGIGCSSIEFAEMLIGAEPRVFSKVPNKWGDKGATTIALAQVDERTALSALKMSWRHAAPPKLLKEIGDG